MTLSFRVAQLYAWLKLAGERLQPVLLLAMRLYWGWSFFLTGRGKLLNLDRTTEFFAGLGLPFPKLNVLLAGSTECAGGLLLLLGFASRIVSVPLGFTLGVAYLTADREALTAIFSDPDKFVTSDPFPFLLTCVLIFAFGPGVFSVDWLIAKYWLRKPASGTPGLEARSSGAP